MLIDTCIDLYPRPLEKYHQKRYGVGIIGTKRILGLRNVKYELNVGRVKE